MLEAQARALRHIETLKPGNANGAGQPLRCDPGGADPLAWHAEDLLLRLEIAPGSISTVEIGPWGPRILRINEEA